ncbi:hypothetical protein THAOC_26784 [Thalassiosira oceanica]|uniref:DUF6743 domain-containing protein n=1 Tax=Thalassiosira oceanica TaxID=159749 RepID=K0S4D0_THAOC|nr:hypothetical protein THAOC_26784 [Thalassiosira oceanica]|eukprot:EJK53717.1 hypothetical protein THAOC_26784 [Thalassiosira oceanica]
MSTNQPPPLLPSQYPTVHLRLRCSNGLADPKSNAILLPWTPSMSVHPHWAPSPQLVKCGRARSGCEKTCGISKWKSLRIYGRQELWSHGFGARPVSDGPYQPVDAADVRRRVAFGARQDNEFAVRHCCVHRSRWSVVSGARAPRGASKPLVTTSLVSEREEAVRPQIEFSAVDLSPEKDLQHRLEVLALATDGEERFPMEGRRLSAVKSHDS